MSSTGGVNGGSIGEVFTLQTSDGRRVTWRYVRDPECNLVVLQRWSSPDA